MHDAAVVIAAIAAAAGGQHVGIGAHFFLRESVHTAPIIAAARLPCLGVFIPSLAGSALNLGVVLAGLLLVLVPL